MRAKFADEDFVNTAWDVRPLRRRERHVWPAHNKVAIRRNRRWWRRALLDD